MCLMTKNFKKGITGSVILGMMAWAGVSYSDKVELGSLQSMSNNDIKVLARTLSSVTAPKVMVHNEALGWLKFDVGVEQAFYRISSDVRAMLKSKAIGHSDLDEDYYLSFLIAKVGWPWGVNSEVSLFLPGAIDKFGVTSFSLKWVPPFLAKDRFFITPGVRQSYTHARFSQYKSGSWTPDIILSTQKILGLGLQGGASMIQIFGKYNGGVLRVGQPPEPHLWTERYFGGIDHTLKLFEKMSLNLAFEAARMRHSKAYSLKTTLLF